MEAIETRTHRGYTLELHYDDDPSSPREDENVGTMVCGHRNYILGDEQIKTEEYGSWADVRAAIEAENNVAVILPLGLYDHSGITMYVGGTTDPWDSGQVGWIYCTTEQVEHEWTGDYDGKTPLERAESYLRGEVETYDSFLTGRIYGYVVTGPDNFLESCWGFYDEDDAWYEATAAADSEADDVIRTNPAWWVRMAGANILSTTPDRENA